MFCILIIHNAFRRLLETASMDLPLRKTTQLKVKQLDLISLKSMASKLKNIKRRSFAEKFGNILDLLEVDVQEGALTALAQFYDPTL